MIPSYVVAELATENAEQPSRTYTVDPLTKRIYGRIDGLQAVGQAINKLLNTERFAHVIYDDQYGAELDNLIGQSADYVKSVLEHRLKDALLSDNRIIDLTDFKIIDITKERIRFMASIVSTFGNIKIEF